MNDKMSEIASTLDRATNDSAQMFFEKLAILAEADLKLEESVFLAGRFGDFLKQSPSELFLKALSKDDCPDFLGIHAAKFGRLEYQTAYLFGSHHDVDSYVTRVRLRSNSLKEMFLQRGFPTVLRILFNTDSFSYLMWARCLGYPGTPAHDKFPDEVVDVFRAKKLVRCWLDSDLCPIYKNISDDYFKAKREDGETLTYHGWVFDNLGQMGWDLYHNNWGNGYGFMAREIKALLSEQTWGLPVLLKKSMQIDASILIGNQNRKNSCYVYTDVEEDALSRMEDVVAFWCSKNPHPIEYRKN
jgi:hypothetical protein